MKYKVTNLEFTLLDGFSTSKVETYVNKIESEGWKLVSFTALSAMYYVFIWEKA